MDQPEAMAQRGKSVAMTLTVGALALEVLVLIVVVLNFLRFGFDPFFFIIIAFALAFAIFLGLAMWRRPRPWVYLVSGILLIAFLALNAPFLLPSLAKPVGDPVELPWAGVLGVIVSAAGAIASFIAFRQVRRGVWTAVWQARGPELLAAGIAGLLLGIFYVSFVGSNAIKEAGGVGVENAVQELPNQSPLTLEAKDVKWSTNDLAAQTGVLPIYVINRDELPHTFDIQVGEEHLSYPLAGKSTAGVLVKIDAPGKYTYRCAIPAHEAMEGTLTVAG